MFEWTEERVSFMADACERTDFHEKLAALLAPYLKKTDSICDAGCGLGYLSLALSPLVGHVTAAERDDRALDVLRRRTDDGYEFGVRRPDGRYAALALLRAEV